MTTRKMSAKEFAKLAKECQSAGFGNDPREDPADYDKVVVVDGKMMPAWMAEVFGRMAAGRDVPGGPGVAK